MMTEMKVLIACILHITKYILSESVINDFLLPVVNFKVSFHPY